MESTQEIPTDKEHTHFTVEQVLASGDELLQKAQRVSQSIEERVRNLLRDVNSTSGSK